MSVIVEDNRALTGSIIKTFYYFALPSVIGLIAMSSASIVDGIFIGNYVGSSALAAVNLIMPFLSLMFGLGFMLTMGGSVRAGKYIGEMNRDAASAIFSKTMVVVAGFAFVVVTLGLIFEQKLFRLFGASDELIPLMSDYFRIIVPFLLAQMITVVMYFYVRIDGFPNLAAIALFAGAVINIFLDYIFIAHLGWGLTGAAWATGISQLFQASVLLTYFLHQKRQLYFSFQQKQWSEIFQSALNGISEFINEVSAGLITFMLNWMLMLSVGVDGVAAITVINYLLMIGLMLFFSVADASQVFISQNYGARQAERISRFLLVSMINVVMISALCIGLLLGFTDPLIQMFLDSDSTEAVVLAAGYVGILWSIFIFNGFNVSISAYLTAIHLPIQSGLVALSRSLILPAGFLLILYNFLPEISFLWALPAAELLTFILAVLLYLRHQPHKAISTRL